LSPNPTHMKNLTIALANDHPQLREGFTSLLESMGHTVCVQADNGWDLLRQLNSSTTQPRVCIMDLHMPVMDGFELAKQIKEIYPGMKVVAFSMSGNREEIEQVLACGADSFVHKGEFEELQELLLSYS